MPHIPTCRSIRRLTVTASPSKISAARPIASITKWGCCCCSRDIHKFLRFGTRLVWTNFRKNYISPIFAESPNLPQIMKLMKILKYLLPAVLAFSFAGCLDINESVDIRKDGSGQLTMDMDMSQMVDILQTYMGKEELEKKGMSKMDTTILLKDIVDTLSSMSEDKKAILRPGRVHIKLDMDAKVFTVHSMFPFTSL